MDCILTIKPQNIKIKAEKGTLISQILKNRTDLEMVCGGNGTCGKCRVIATGEMSPLTEREKTLPKGWRLACTAKIMGDVSVFVPQNRIDQQILTELRLPTLSPKEKKETEKENYGIAFDIGSTTIAAYLCDLNRDTIVSSASLMNPQIVYGDDLISRINYINTHQEGLEELQSSVIGACNRLIETFSEKTDSITKAVFVGNTCMNHIILGINPKSLGESPYEPVIYERVIKDAEELNINIRGKLFFFPNIAGFVGGDTVGVILSCMKTDTEKTLLAVDIGTNGEMALRHRGKLYVCSAAAGPAFEGGGISRGMRGGRGAVDKATLENDDIKIHIIGNTEPKGICGSGLTDLINALVECKAVNMSGRLEEDEAPDKIAEKIIPGTRGNDFIFAKTESDTLTLTQGDIRNMQLAKGSIAAAIKTLLSYAEITEKDLDRVYIAGGFGNYLNIKSALGIGLLPDIDINKIEAIGNGAGAGAVMALLREEEWEYTEIIRKEAEHIELAHSPDYQQNLMDAMMFE